MLFGFYQLISACKKYGFTFTLESEQKNRVEIIIKPIDLKCRIQIVESSYRKIFKKAIYRMKLFRR